VCELLSFVSMSVLLIGRFYKFKFCCEYNDVSCVIIGLLSVCGRATRVRGCRGCSPLCIAGGHSCRGAQLGSTIAKRRTHL
jgi:hypothetical protein